MSIQAIGPAAIPSLGLGTYRSTGAAAVDIVKRALAEGYTQLDTAQFYDNEAAIGQALAEAAIPRERVFITTKIFPSDFSARDFVAAAERSLSALGTDYVDLLLLHWPSREVPLEETLGALNAVIRAGKARFGGVSNFTIAQTEAARALLDTPLAANQIEFHPLLDQRRLTGRLEALGVPFQAYMPLARGGVVAHPLLTEIGAGHRASAAQVALAWALSKPGAVVLPKTLSPPRLKENLAATELRLSEEEIARIDALGTSAGRLCRPAGLEPDWD